MNPDQIKMSILPRNGGFVAFLLLGRESIASTLPVMDRSQAAREGRSLALALRAQK